MGGILGFEVVIGGWGSLDSDGHGGVITRLWVSKLLEPARTLRYNLWFAVLCLCFSVLFYICCIFNVIIGFL